MESHDDPRSGTWHCRDGSYLFVIHTGCMRQAHECSSKRLFKQILSAGKDFRREANLVCHLVKIASLPSVIMCTGVAASREILPGRQDLPNSATAMRTKESPRDAHICRRQTLECCIAAQ